MDDTEIRLHCVESADGNLSIAKQIYEWVKGARRTCPGPQTVPIEYATALAYGDHKAGGITLVKA